ncbi:unnamed protein product [Urochloa humidicola]
MRRPYSPPVEAGGCKAGTTSICPIPHQAGPGTRPARCSSPAASSAWTRQARLRSASGSRHLRLDAPAKIRELAAMLAEAPRAPLRLRFGRSGAPHEEAPFSSLPTIGSFNSVADSGDGGRARRNRVASRGIPADRPRHGPGPTLPTRLGSGGGGGRVVAGAGKKSVAPSRSLGS